MKKKYFLLISILFVVFFNINVNAATDTCTTEIKKEYQTIADQVEVKIKFRQPTQQELRDYDSLYYSYDLTINNISTDIYLVIGTDVITYDRTKNGTFTSESYYKTGGYTSQIEIYAASNTKCKGTLLNTIKQYVPFYNPYSDRDECKGHTEEYPICKRDLDVYDISETRFKELLKEGEAKAKEKAKEETEDKKDNAIINVLKYCGIVVVVIAIIALCVIVIDNRNKAKKRAKIDLEVKK